MNAKAIIASLVLGSSSAAMAAPSVTFTAGVTGTATAGYGTTTVIRDRSDDVRTLPAPVYRPIYRPAPQPVGGSWYRPARYQAPVTLASGLSFNGQGRRFISVGRQVGRFGKLEIDAAGGRTFIQQVYVQFEDGQEQVLRNLDRTLTRNERLTLDLDGGRRAIRRIVVYGSDVNTGWRRSAGAFTVTAV